MSKKAVSIWAKKNFLLWFLESYHFEGENGRRLLRQLIESEELLSRTCLVYHSLHLRPLLIISSEGTGIPSLFFKTESKNISDSMTIFNQIQTSQETPIYLTLYFPERDVSEPYQAVAEEPADELGPSKTSLIDFELSLWTEAYRVKMEQADLMRRIDLALDKGDKRQFRRLVKKLKALL